MSLTEAYFIRHGIAQARGDILDEARSLTPKGIDKTQRVAQRLVEVGLQFDVLLSSPLVRAWQTAEILRSAGLATKIEEFLPLSPAGNIADWLAWLARWQTSLLEQAAAEPVSMAVGLVGHEPTLSQWAQQLVYGHSLVQLDGQIDGQLDRQLSDRWMLKKAGIIGLELPTASQAMGGSRLFWLAPPRFLL
jgi:phosphohistidine phosphatase